ncbi:MAG: M20 family metallopeptidase [Acidobacteriales bacterium]|nr:M20 family metallopeptidase [Terriglobales bacterium]
MIEPSKLLGAAQEQNANMLSALRQLVETESPSDDRDAVNRAVDLVEQLARGVSAKSLRHAQPEFGDHLELRFGSSSSAKPLLLLGHLDTVWPMGTLASMPFQLKDDRAWGPGVLDMKCGVIMALTALRMLIDAGALGGEVILLLVSDEEVGSTSSRPLTEAIAKQCSAVLVLEPGQGLYGAAKTWRKGVGQFIVRVHGVASHSGVDFEKGHSAVIELAHQVLKMQKFTDLQAGFTVNPGVISGGTRSNVIAAHAMCEVDVRIQRAADAERIEQLIHPLTPQDPSCRIEISGGINRPPMERTAKVLSLYHRAHDIAQAIGFELREEGTGGGSDGNFTAALGIPTLDGLGAVGEGAHAVHESILLDELPRRTALLAGLIQSLARE